MLFGQMGKELLLEGVHVSPIVLVNTGYVYKYPRLKVALEQVLYNRHQEF
jgi:NAD dependent epimerase/dehydratase family enzyme